MRLFEIEMLDNYLILGNEKIEIRYISGEIVFAKEAFDALEQGLPAISAYFNVSQPFPLVRVVLVPNRDEFDRLVRDLLQIKIEVPSHPARIAQPQRTDMVLLSPPAYAKHSVFQYKRDEFARLVVHELVHMVEEHLSPNIEMTPRWWSEGLAVYLSKQWMFEDDFRKPAAEGVRLNHIPRIEQIETSTALAYDWGWTLIRFMEETYGKSLLLKIVHTCRDGQVFAMIEDEISNFENRWRDWLMGLK